MELPFGFIMDYVYQPSKFDFDSIPDYLELYAAREFGPGCAKDIAAVLLEYSRLVGRRKFESLAPTTYSWINYHEAETVLDEWNQLAERTDRIAESLPSEYQATFYHLAGYQVAAGANYHRVVIGQGRNLFYATQRRNMANRVAQEVFSYFEHDFDLGEHYDNIAGGKWKGMMSQPKFDLGVSDDWRQSSRDVLANLSYVQLRQNTNFEFGPLGIWAEGRDNLDLDGLMAASIEPAAPSLGDWSPVLPQIDRYGPQIRTAEIYHRGDHRIPINWTVSNEHDWLNVAPVSGQISDMVPQQRVNFSVDWDNAPSDYNGTVDVTVTWDAVPYFDLIHVPVRTVEAPSDFHGFPQTGHMISIEAPHFQRQSHRSAEDVSFTTLPHLGTRSNSGALALRPYTAAREDSFEPDDTYVEYDIYVFDACDTLNATVYVTAGLDTDPTLPMKYSLSLDSRGTNYTRVLPEPEVAGDLPDNWEDEVANSVWTLMTPLGPAEEGKHTLRWSVNSPEVYLEKIVLGVNETVGESYLGPPESVIV